MKNWLPLKCVDHFEDKMHIAQVCIPAPPLSNCHLPSCQCVVAWHACTLHFNPGLGQEFHPHIFVGQILSTIVSSFMDIVIPFLGNISRVPQSKVGIVRNRVWLWWITRLITEWWGLPSSSSFASSDVNGFCPSDIRPLTEDILISLTVSSASYIH